MNKKIISIILVMIGIWGTECFADTVCTYPLTDCGMMCISNCMGNCQIFHETRVCLIPSKCGRGSASQMDFLTAVQPQCYEACLKRPCTPTRGYY